MKQRKKVLLSLLSLVFLCSIGMQTGLVANASSGGGKAGITLKKAEETSTSSTAESTDKTVPTSDETPSGKGIVNLPNTGEKVGSGLLIVVGIGLAWFSIRQMKQQRK